MKLNKLVSTALLSTVLGLSPAVSAAKDKVQKEVYQLAWDKLIPTTTSVLKNYKTNWCVEYNWVKIYISDEKDVIPTWFYFDVKDPDIIRIKSSPECKNDKLTKS